MKRRVITNIQILRFVAAASVLLTHTASVLIPGDPLFFRFPWTGGVDLFFVISGFIMTWLTRDRFGEAGVPRRFLLRRAIRIVPPYWFFTSLMVATTLLAGAHVRKTVVGAAEIVTSYAFIPWPRPSDGALNPLLSQGWTLNYEMFFYAAFAAALCFRGGLRWLVLAFLALAALHYAVPREIFVLRFYSSPIILEFVAGIGIARLYIAGVRLPLWGALGLAALAACAFAAAGWLPRFEDSRFLWLGAPATLLIAGFALLRDGPSEGRVRRLLRLGGDASYTLYLSHTFTVNAIAILWRAHGRGGPWIGVGIAAAAATAIAILLYRFAERPVTEALSRFFGLSPPDAAQRVAP